LTESAGGHQATKIFAALDLKSIALLLDVDGTLIDLAPTPHAVAVPDSLRVSLSRLDEATQGALAFVSGRMVADLDGLFAPLRLSAVGGHGAQMRIAGTMIDSGVRPLPKELRHRLSAAQGWGVLIEDKTYSFALHFRLVPDQAERTAHFVEQVCAQFPNEALEVLPGKQVLEVKRLQIDKGRAVRALLKHKPFTGRIPVFIGDDFTDESVFAVLPEFDGKAFSVGEEFASLAGMFDTPAQVRAALAKLAARA
jgi:trehalose 6-phosphate phosphatase